MKNKPYKKGSKRDMTESGVLVWTDFSKQKVVAFNDYLKLHQSYIKAIEALKFYANEDNYEMRPEYDESGKMKNACILLNDLESFLDYYTCGKNKARETLKEVGEI